MNNFNFYQKKYEALESFYGWVDQGSDYDVAVEQSLYYDKEKEGLDEIIFNITIATRFARCGREISANFKEKIRKTVYNFRNNTILENYDLTKDELMILNEEVKEIEGLL